MSEVIQPWTDGYWVAFTEHDPTFSNFMRYGVAGLFEDINVWIHEFTESTLGEWMNREYYYISQRAIHILTSLAVYSGVRTHQGMKMIGPDEYWERTTLGKQKKLTFWWKLDDRTSALKETQQ